MPPNQPPEHQVDTKAPTWSNAESTVKQARSASAPGPNGVPYRLYKNTLCILKHLWKLMKVAWKKVDHVKGMTKGRRDSDCKGEKLLCHQPVPPDQSFECGKKDLFQYCGPKIHLSCRIITLSTPQCTRQG